MKRRCWSIVGVAAIAAGGAGYVSHPPSAPAPPSLPVVANAEHQGQFRPASGCGIERWAIKTLTDPGANQVDLTNVVPSTVAELGAKPVPANPTDRVAGLETTVYRVSGMLTVAKTEADHDFHLVIEDKGATMIVEIPDPACATGSLVADQLAQVRSQFTAKFGTPGSYPKPDLKPNVPVTVTGIGFFDRIHRQTGVAKNGLELHPLIAFSTP